MQFTRQGEFSAAPTRQRSLRSPGGKKKTKIKRRKNKRRDDSRRTRNRTRAGRKILHDSVPNARRNSVSHTCKRKTPRTRRNVVVVVIARLRRSGMRAESTRDARRPPNGRAAAAAAEAGARAKESDTLGAEKAVCCAPSFPFPSARRPRRALPHTRRGFYRSRTSVQSRASNRQQKNNDDRNRSRFPVSLAAEFVCRKIEFFFFFNAGRRIIFAI